MAIRSFLFGHFRMIFCNYRFLARASIDSFRWCRIFSRSVWLFENRSPNDSSSLPLIEREQRKTIEKLAHKIFLLKCDGILRFGTPTFRHAKDHYDYRRYLYYAQFHSQHRPGLRNYSYLKLNWLCYYYYCYC